MATKNVVFVHGFMGSALNWGPVLTALRKSPLKEQWAFHPIDLLGHGGRRQSPLGSYEVLSLNLMTEDLRLQTESLQPFLAVGHSFGLRPLLRLSELYPEALHGLIVEDSSPQVDRKNFEFLMGILNNTPRKFHSRAEANSYFSSQFPGKIGAFLLSNIRQNPSDPNEFGWRFDLAGLRNVLQDAFENPQWAAWEKIQKRVAIIRGERSDFLTKERLQEMLARRPLATEIHEVGEAGHWIHSDKPDEFVNILINLISSWDAGI